MSTIKLSQPHSVSIDEARTKVQGFDDAKINIKFGCPTKPAG